jgi:hypothetical protein
MTVPDLKQENARLRADLARQHSAHARAVIELRTRLAEAEGKLRDIDTLCESSWLNVGAVIPADELPVDFGRFAISVDEVQDVLRDGIGPVREVFYQAFLTQLDRRDSAVEVLTQVAELAERNDDAQLSAVLSLLPDDWAFQVARRRKLTRTGAAGAV